MKFSQRRNYQSPEKHIVIVNNPDAADTYGDEMFQLKVELSSKRNISLKVKEQTKSYDKKHYSHVYTSSERGVKKEDEWDQKLFETPDKQASPIKKWLKHSKIQ